MRQEKRHKLQLFYEILCAIEEDAMHNEVARPTHVQHFTRLSYDKMMNHFDELEEKGMIHRVSGLVAITAKGRMFIEQYDQLISLIESAGL
ncbi:winged helix-turn-helix domain-containing protein [Candidatus Nitrososphaera gargensis]|uniref:winged helix-turn-helix domain-containing protein n=1 Tax=Candidatus Nitrososphaera gargensis TaxID=497727 RepID=UPI0011E51ECE|nr:winged helix-turn-helix domain-containing protein [Candidatus Nitrososphaera gargensis]